MNKFEYYILNRFTMRSDEESLLVAIQKLGNNGWEMCGVDNRTDNALYIFKKTKLKNFK